MATAHEYITFSNNQVAELADSLIIRGVVVADSIDDEANTMSVTTVEYGQLDDVPIFYHCEDETTVDEGWSAFSDTGELSAVMIFIPNGRNTGPAGAEVVGFWDGRPRDCLKGEGVMYAELFDGTKTWSVVWNIKERAYADDVIDDNGHTIDITEWPYDKDLLDDFFDASERVGLFFASDQWGNNVVGTGASCSCTAVNCAAADTDSDSGDNPFRPGKTDSCTCSRFSCCRTPAVGCAGYAEHEHCTEPEEDENLNEISYAKETKDSNISSTSEIWTGNSALFGSWKDQVNGFDVVIAEHVTSSFSWLSNSVKELFFNCPSGSAASWSHTSSQSTDNYLRVEIDTPWGTIFQGFNILETIHSSGQSGSGSGAFPGCVDATSCSGFAWVTDPLPNKTARSIRNIYIDEGQNGDPGHTVFGIVACVIRQSRNTPSIKSVIPCDVCSFDQNPFEDPRIEAIGTVGWFDDASIIDVNSMAAAPDIGDGIVKLIEKNIAERTYDQMTITSTVFHHRLYFPISSSSV